jgi:superfamily II DNA or RNA helicase
MAFKELTLKEGYSSSLDHVLDDFYRPVIANSVYIKRAVGYFRSTVYMLMHQEILEFVKRGGKIQLICSVELSKEDIQTLKFASEGSVNSCLDGLITKELKQIEDDLKHALHSKVLAGLIKINALDLRIAVKHNGLFHDKRGLLFDAQGDVISFVGSGNETYSAWGCDGNSENFEVFCSFKEKDNTRVERHNLEFEKILSNQFKEVQIYPLSEALKQNLIKQAPKDQEELDKIWTKYQNITLSQSVVTNPEGLKTEQETEDFPSGRIMQSHQLNALDAWYQADQHGILQLATGAGKTFIGINAIRSHIRSGRLALVLVPSKILLHDWHEELSSELPQAKFLLIGDGHNKWKREGVLRRFSGALKTSTRHIIIGINDSIRTNQFLRRLRNISDILLVSDEVHTLGSPENQNIFNFDFGYRLGLSATPERYGDEEGTSRLFAYFSGKVGTPFTLKDAQNAGRLVQYNYYPKYAYLTEDEKDSWQKITKKLKKSYAMRLDDEGALINDDYLNRLRIQRARIAKNAQMKLNIARDILSEYYQPNTHWLVYCDNQHQIAQLKEMIEPLKLPIFVYHSAMEGCRDKTLDHYKQVGGVLIAINCLDEGVDIPQLEYGIIIASSQNPRQFIQRRGRLLRTTKAKTLAHIWDILVIPHVRYDEEDINLQDSLTSAELARALEFGHNALNQDRLSTLKRKINELNISLETYTSKLTY